MPTGVPASPITDQEAIALDTLINERDNPNDFLIRLLYPSSTVRLIDTETVQLEKLTGGRTKATFNRPDSQPTLVSKRSGSVSTVTMPNITQRRVLSYSDRLLQRRLGDPNAGLVGLTNNGIVRRNALRELADDMVEMAEMIENTEEWMVSQILQGTMTYSVEGEDNFTVTTGKPAGNTVNASVAWDLTTATPNEDIDVLVKKTISDNNGPAPDVAVCGSNAAAVIRAAIRRTKETKDGGIILDSDASAGALIAAGRFSYMENFTDSGAIYLGMINGIPHWEYSRLDEESGSALVRTDYIEYFSQSARAVSNRRMFYGPIHDIESAINGNHVSRRWTKTHLRNDSLTSYESIIGSRPLPFDRRPDWTVSLKIDNL